MDQEIRERFEAQQQAQKEQTEHSATVNSATQSAQSRVTENIMNPNFQAQLEAKDLDTDEYPWIEDELGPELAGSHLTGNRDEEAYEQEIRWLDPNKAERILAEKSPGRLLRQNPAMLKLAQRKNPELVDDPGIEEPMSRSKDRRAIRSAMDVATNRKSLAAGMSGLDATTTATAETRRVTNEENDSSTRDRVAKLWRGR